MRINLTECSNSDNARSSGFVLNLAYIDVFLIICYIFYSLTPSTKAGNKI